MVWLLVPGWCDGNTHQAVPGASSKQTGARQHHFGDKAVGLRKEFSPLLQAKQWKEKEQQDPLREGEREGLLPPAGLEVRQKHGSWVALEPL